MLNQDNELSKYAIINNEYGIHSRPAAKISQIAQNAVSDIWIQKGDQQVDATSIIDILSLECPKGTQIKIIVTNPSDLDILDNIIELIENKFGE